MEHEKEIYQKKKGDIYNIDPRLIRVQKGFNSRVDFGDINELATQIKEAGVLNPLTVKPYTDENGVEVYRLVDGERRYRAVMQLLGEGVDIARVPALFLSKSTTEYDMLIQQIMRNGGKQFNEYEQGLHYHKMIEKSKKERSEIAKDLGLTTPEGKCISWRIDICLKHLERDERIQTMLKNNEIDGSVVRQVYQQYPNDEQSAVNEILNMKKNFEKKKDVEDNFKRKKITLADLSDTSLAKVRKDGEKIKIGLKLLIKYLEPYCDEDGNLTIDLNVFEITNEISKTNTIKDILESKKAESENGLEQVEETA